MKQLNRKDQEKDCETVFHFQQTGEIHTLHHSRSQREIMVQSEPNSAIKNTNKWALCAFQFPWDSN